MKENANSRRNMQVVGDMYARVMRALAEKEGKGESYPSLKEAPVERLPYLVEKFIQAARKSNMEVYASGTFHFIWNGVANILSSRETDPVNVKTDVNFRRAREILAKKANESAQAGRPPGEDSKNPVKLEHLQLALSAGTIGRGNPKALVCFTHIACTVGFGLRPGTECHAITNGSSTIGLGSSPIGLARMFS